MDMRKEGLAGAAPASGLQDGRQRHLRHLRVVAAEVQAALEASGWRLDGEFVGLAVFGLAAGGDTRLHDGDRVELLRALQVDPKQARRLRAERDGVRRTRR